MIAGGGHIDGLHAILAVTQLPALLLLLALGLWHARRHPARLDLSIILLAAGLGAGLAAHPFGIRLPEIAPALIALVIAIFVVTDSPKLSVLQPALFLAGGLAIALSSSASLEIGPGLLCIVALAMVPVAIAYYLAILPRHPVVTIGRRIAGSWILAVSLLIAAFHFKSLGN